MTKKQLYSYRVEMTATVMVTVKAETDEEAMKIAKRIVDENQDGDDLEWYDEDNNNLEARLYLNHPSEVEIEVCDKIEENTNGCSY